MQECHKSKKKKSQCVAKNTGIGMHEDDDKRMNALVILIRLMVPKGKHGRASTNAIAGHLYFEVK